MSASSKPSVQLTPSQRLALVKAFTNSVKKLQAENAKKLAKKRRVLKAPKGATVVSAVLASPRSEGSHKVYKAVVVRPKVKKSPAPKLAGLKKLFKSPKSKSPKKSSSLGLKKLYKSPKKVKKVKKPLGSSSLKLAGVKKLFKAPKKSPAPKKVVKKSMSKSPKLVGVKKLFKSPKKARKPTEYNAFVKKHFHDAALQGLTPQEKMVRLAAGYKNCNQWL